MMTLTLTPEQERRLTANAKRRQKHVERVVEDWIVELPGEPRREKGESFAEGLDLSDLKG